MIIQFISRYLHNYGLKIGNFGGYFINEIKLCFGVYITDLISVFMIFGALEVDKEGRKEGRRNWPQTKYFILNLISLCFLLNIFSMAVILEEGLFQHPLLIRSRVLYVL